jgi:hypothetical protein
MSRFPGSEQNMAPIAPVVLTDEEQQECQAMLHELIQVGGGYYAIREELLDPFKRSIVALCMMGRAERFLMLAGCGLLGSRLSPEDPADPEYAEKACQAAAKACGVFPLSMYFYDYGCILQQVGKTAEAKQMFAEFLRRVGSETLDPIMELVLKQRDVEAALRHARQSD